jgi:hypothetical protein
MAKTEYELYLRTWSHLNPNAERDRDYETIDFDPCVNYRDAVKRAKELSKKVPYRDAHGIEIVQVQIAAYIDGEEEKYGTSYYLLWKETYENGKRLGRIWYKL